jgi:hypothetical protein
MVPTARLLPDGVDLHIAGDDEATALLSALSAAMTHAGRVSQGEQPC